MSTHAPTRQPSPGSGAASLAPASRGTGCEATAELLPWLLNGSLSAAERRPLLDHLAGCESCRGELAATVEAARVFSQHVPSFALAEYGQGLTPQELDSESIEAHLARCPSCREELALIRSADQVTDLAAARARRSALSTLSALSARMRRPWVRLAVAAAAVLALGLVLLRSLGPAPGTGTAPSAVARQVTAPAADPLRQATTRSAPASGVVFADGFEPGSGQKWSQSLLSDGFESGDESRWSRESG